MSWWQRERGNLFAWVIALIVGYLVWSLSQWASDATWADLVGGISAMLIGFVLLNKYLRRVQREQ